MELHPYIDYTLACLSSSRIQPDDRTQHCACLTRTLPLFNLLQKMDEVLNSTVFFFNVFYLMSPVFIDRSFFFAFNRVEFPIGLIEIWL